MLEGIGSFVSRPDLIDRALIIALESPPNHRRTQRELWADLEKYQGRIFGALCDMLAAGVRRLPETRLLNPPRMADFATWAVACGVGGLEAAYARSRQGAIDVILEHDLLAQSLEALMATRREWRGAAHELLDQIGEAAPISDPRALSDRLRRLAQPLRSHGILIAHEPRKNRLREIVIARE
jgi:hypothetical protein